MERLSYGRSVTLTMMMFFFQTLRLHGLVEEEPSDRDGRVGLDACGQELFSISVFLSLSSFFPCW